MAAAAKTPPKLRKRSAAPQGRRSTPRPMFMPYDKSEGIEVVQPPAELAHLEGDDLYEALTDPERLEEVTGRPPAKWDSARFVAELGRSPGRFKAWMSHYYTTLKPGYKPGTINDRIMVAPDGYDRRSPYWLETTARWWAIEEGIMTRGGVLVPYKPTGRPKGKTDTVPRQRRRPITRGVPLEILAACEELTAGGATLAEARVALAERYGLTVRVIARRLTAGRKMRGAGVRAITDDMSTRERAEIIMVMFRLLMADGRRKYAARALHEVAERLGVPLEEARAAADAALMAAATTAPNPGAGI